MKREIIGQGIDNQGVFYLVPNQMNGIVCRTQEMAKKLAAILGDCEDVNAGIEKFNRLAFYECPESEDCFSWAIERMA